MVSIEKESAFQTRFPLTATRADGGIESRALPHGELIRKTAVIQEYRFETGKSIDTTGGFAREEPARIPPPPRFAYDRFAARPETPPPGPSVLFTSFSHSFLFPFMFADDS
jgi:hypothetical protein